MWITFGTHRVRHHIVACAVLRCLRSFTIQPKLYQHSVIMIMWSDTSINCTCLAKTILQSLPEWSSRIKSTQHPPVRLCSWHVVKLGDDWLRVLLPPALADSFSEHVTVITCCIDKEDGKPRHTTTLDLTGQSGTSTTATSHQQVPIAPKPSTTGTKWQGFQYWFSQGFLL